MYGYFSRLLRFKSQNPCNAGTLYILGGALPSSLSIDYFSLNMGYLLKLLLQSIARQDMAVGAKSPHGSLFCQSHRLSVYMLPICNTYSSAHVENAI